MQQSIHYFVLSSWMHSFLGKGNPQNPRTLHLAYEVSNSLALIMSKLIGGLACKDANTDPPKNNDDATVHVCQINL